MFSVAQYFKYKLTAIATKTDNSIRKVRRNLFNKHEIIASWTKFYFDVFT